MTCIAFQEALELVDVFIQNLPNSKKVSWFKNMEGNFELTHELIHKPYAYIKISISYGGVLG